MSYSPEQIAAAMTRAAQALRDEHVRLNDLDQAMGDGDIGITLDKIGEALIHYAATETIDDVGKWLGKAGMVANKAGSSSFGTLLATALMRGGKTVTGKTTLDDTDVAAIFTAAAEGMQERGKAKLGDKTVLDAIIPAASALKQALDAGKSLAEAGSDALTAAETGRDAVTPLVSKIGRAGWVGERTAGLVDPGCEAFVVVLRTLVT